MKLFLSSYRIPDPKVFCEFVGKKPTDIKFALILNSKDYKPADEREKKLFELLGYFRGFGFDVQELNLLNFDNPKDLLNELKKYDVLWFNGGNVYYLRWVISKVGGEEVIREALNDGVIYGGDSAGAIIAGPTLKYYDIADVPTFAPETIYDGLNLVDLAILPHWNSGDFGLVVKEVEDKLIKDGFKTKRLTDTEYLLVENGKIKNSQDI